jgi:hypothetical protein
MVAVRTILLVAALLCFGLAAIDADVVGVVAVAGVSGLNLVVVAHPCLSY